MTSYEFARETLWFIEEWDVQLEEWHGAHPYTEWEDADLAQRGFESHKAAVPGGRARLVRENRSRVVVVGDR